MFIINKHKVFSDKYLKLENYQQALKNESGLYFFHVNNKLKYVGESKDLWNRFKNGYLKKNSKQHINMGIMGLIDSNPKEIEVIFAPMDKSCLKDQESLWIQEHIPEFNERENPRYEIHPIQKTIGRIVNSSNREWSFAEMKEHLYDKWRGHVSKERIEEALRNHKHLTNHCKQSQKKETLNPKKKKLA